MNPAGLRALSLCERTGTASMGANPCHGSEHRRLHLRIAIGGPLGKSSGLASLCEPVLATSWGVCSRGILRRGDPWRSAIPAALHLRNMTQATVPMSIAPEPAVKNENFFLAHAGRSRPAFYLLAGASLIACVDRIAQAPNCAAGSGGPILANFTHYCERSTAWRTPASGHPCGTTGPSPSCPARPRRGPWPRPRRCESRCHRA